MASTQCLANPTMLFFAMSGCSQGRPSTAELMLQVRVERGGKGLLCARCEGTGGLELKGDLQIPVHSGWEHCVLLTAKG